jgi:uncharacterized protein (TIGR03083 family)
VEQHEYTETVRAESDRLAAAAEAVGLDTDVESCPGWTMKDLVVHVGNVHRWAAEIVRTAAQERLPFGDPPAIADAELLPWFRDGAVVLVAVLEAADPATPLWTFGLDGTVAFWLRRQAQETAVHRWDAQGAAGTAEPLGGALAADGIDEWLALLARRGARAGGGNGETVHLHCTDVGGEWLVTRTPDGIAVEPVHAKGDVAARGTASDLDLYLWGRGPVDALEVFGDVAVLDALRVAGTR